MFYSHESKILRKAETEFLGADDILVLSNSQYGVATIWLVATVGKGTSRKVTRKAIQEVNVPKACEKIIEPGAPLALRLQGNLLYGTTRVFAQQCGYVLSDAEKTQSDMKTFFRIVRTSEVDPKAGKTDRQDIILPDDPTFDPFAVIPSLDLLKTTSDTVFNYSQASATRYSELSPPDLSRTDSTPRSLSSLAGLEMPSSSHSLGPYRLPSDMDRKNSSFLQQDFQSDPMADFNMLADERTEAAPIQLNFDEFGNFVGFDETEHELPVLPEFPDSRPHMGVGVDEAADAPDENLPLTGEDCMPMQQECPLPEAEAFEAGILNMTSGSLTTDSVEFGRATAKNKRATRRKAKPTIALDLTDKISRDEFKSWSRDYVELMETARRHRKTTTIAQAKRNALAFISGNGIADVGKLSAFGGVLHPLASHFAGDALESLLQGLDPMPEAEQNTNRRRRSADEAFEDERDENYRRVKPKPDAQDEMGRGLRDDDVDILMFEDNSAPEIGMEPVSAMAERHSSTTLPWSRPGSAAPGSSVRGFGSAQKMAPDPSPLFGRGHIDLAIVRRSDSITQTSDDLGQHHFMSRPSTPTLPSDLLNGLRIDTDFGGIATLDVASQEFLGYVKDKVRESGAQPLHDGRIGTSSKNWVTFDQLADPTTHTREVAAQAFLHVLSLATKNVFSVEQDGAKDLVPFGQIRVGISAGIITEAEKLAGFGEE